MRLKLANNEEHAEVVRQAMTDYEERKRRETEARYQRRLFIFAENQEAIAAERADQWQVKARKIEEAKQTVNKRERSFRESVKEKLSQKFEKLKENYHKYHVSRQETVRMRIARIDVVKECKERQIEEKALATAEKIKQQFEANRENREADIHQKVVKIQKHQARIEEAKENLNRSIEISSAKKMMQLEVRLDRSAVKRQLFEAEIRKKAQADLDKVEQVKRLREEKEQEFSESAKENLAQKFESAEKVREENMVAKQRAMEKQVERKVKAKIPSKDGQRLREKIEEKQQRSEENRKAILDAKVEQCRQESSKVKQTKEIVEEQTRNQERAVEERLEAKLNAYKENRQRRLSERKVVKKSTTGGNDRASLQEITNDSWPEQVIRSPTTIEESAKPASGIENGKNEIDREKLKKLAENFRNRNLEYSALR